MTEMLNEEAGNTTRGRTWTENFSKNDAFKKGAMHK
jgi:hypothetical protein